MIRFEMWKSAITSERASFGASTIVKAGKIVERELSLVIASQHVTKILEVQAFGMPGDYSSQMAPFSIPTPAHSLLHVRIVIGHPYQPNVPN